MFAKWIVVVFCGFGVLLSLASCLPPPSNGGEGSSTDVSSEEEEVVVVPRFPLEPDIDDFLEMVPSKKIRDLALESYRKDEYVHGAFAYLNGDEFKALKAKALELPVVGNMVRFANDSGLDLLVLFEKLSDTLGIPPKIEALGGSDESHSSEDRQTSAGQGLTNLFEKLLLQFPQDEIFLLFFEKLESSAAFSHFVERVGSGEFERLCTAIQVS